MEVSEQRSDILCLLYPLAAMGSGLCGEGSGEEGG